MRPMYEPTEVNGMAIPIAMIAKVMSINGHARIALALKSETC